MEKNFKNKKYTSLEITEEEKKGIESYASAAYKYYNNLLDPSLADDNEKKAALDDILIRNDYGNNPDFLDIVLKYTPLIYSAMCKYRIEHGNADNLNLYRGTSEEEVKKQIENRNN